MFNEEKRRFKGFFINPLMLMTQFWNLIELQVLTAIINMQPSIPIKITHTTLIDIVVYPAM